MNVFAFESFHFTNEVFPAFQISIFAFFSFFTVWLLFDYTFWLYVFCNNKPTDYANIIVICNFKNRKTVG